jgi:hypothetical protein
VYMGCIPGDANCAADENPRHVVSITAFQITEASITQGQFLSVAGQNPSSFANCGADCPVETVSWTEASDFCAAIGGRLPTEAEWEYAARAWTNDIYYDGCNDALCLGDLAWYGSNSGGATQPVCGKTPNAWGLCDPLGDVDQWVNDWYDATYYQNSPQQDPQGPTSGTYRVVRGGSFGDGATTLRTSARGWLTPESAVEEVGFRCARGGADDDNDDNDNDDNDDDTAGQTVWTDPTTGLMWQNGAAVGEYGYDEPDAVNYCADLRWDGYGGWRLPDIDELRSLIRGNSYTVTGGYCGVTDSCLTLSCCVASSCDVLPGGPGPGPDVAFWPPEVSGYVWWYWSSSAVADDANYAWGVNFFYGIINDSVDSTNFNVARCVRL